MYLIQSNRQPFPWDARNTLCFRFSLPHPLCTRPCHKVHDVTKFKFWISEKRFLTEIIHNESSQHHDARV